VIHNLPKATSAKAVARRGATVRYYEVTFRQAMKVDIYELEQIGRRSLASAATLSLRDGKVVAKRSGKIPDRRSGSKLKKGVALCVGLTPANEKFLRYAHLAYHSPYLTAR